MKNLLYNIRQALHELVHGRNMPELSQIQVPQKVITVDIQTHKVVPQSAPIKVVSPSPVQSISDAVEITKRSVESQSGETPVVLPQSSTIFTSAVTGDWPCRLNSISMMESPFRETKGTAGEAPGIERLILT